MQNWLLSGISGMSSMVFYNIKMHSQVIFGNMSLSSELPAGMWQGISRTHHWPSMCLRVMNKHDPNTCQKQHTWHCPEEERGSTRVSEKSKQTVQNKKHKFTLRSCNLAELGSPSLRFLSYVGNLCHQRQVWPTNSTNHLIFHARLTLRPYSPKEQNPASLNTNTNWSLLFFTQKWLLDILAIASIDPCGP